MGDRGKMPVNAMKRLTVIVPAEDTDLLLRRLMHLGCTELTERPAGEEALSHAVAPVTDKEEITARLDRVRHVLPVLAERRHKHRHVRAEIDYNSFLLSKSAERAEKTVTEAEKILEFTLGMEGSASPYANILAVKEGLRAPLELIMPVYPARAVRYFLIVVVAGTIWPMSFKRLSALGRK